jgi:hypothetical protein
MLHAHFMICTDDRPLKKAPNAFYAVRVDVAMNPFLFGVVDRAVFGVLVLDAAIAGVLFSVDVLRVRGRRLGDELMELLFVHAAKGFHANRAFALTYHRVSACQVHNPASDDIGFFYKKAGLFIEPE